MYIYFWLKLTFSWQSDSTGVEIQQMFSFAIDKCKSMTLADFSEAEQS